MERREGLVYRHSRRYSMSQLIHEEPWHLVMAEPTSVMVIGHPGAIRPFIEELDPWLSEPVIHVICAERMSHLALPDRGTAVLHDVDQMSDTCQTELMAWFGNAASYHTRVVSTSSSSVLPLIAGTRFREELYYRLNSVYIDLTAFPMSVQSPSHVCA